MAMAKVYSTPCASLGFLLLLASISVTSAAEAGHGLLRRNLGVIRIPELDQHQLHRKQVQVQRESPFSDEQVRLLEEAMFMDEEIRFLASIGSFSVEAKPSPIPAVAPAPTIPVVSPTLAPVVAIVPPTPQAPFPLVPPAPKPSSPPFSDPPVAIQTFAPTASVSASVIPFSSFSESPFAAPTETPTTSPTGTPTSVPKTEAAASDTPTLFGTLAPTVLTSTPTAAGTSTPTSITKTVAPIPTTTIAPSSQEPMAERSSRILEKCGVTDLERSRDILTILMGVSEGIDIVSPNTPYYDARVFVDEQDEAIVCASAKTRIEQRYRVALLYYQMNGPQWRNCRAVADAGDDNGCVEVEDDTGNAVRLLMEGSDERRRRMQNVTSEVQVQDVRWLAAAHECGWFGLDCGPAYNQAIAAGVDVDNNDVFLPILNIKLLFNNLAGDLYEELYGFSELQGLYLGGNGRISGSFSSSLGKLTKLQFLDMDENVITGSLPAVIYTMTTLKAIDLNDNEFVGEISNDIGNLLELGVFQIENNGFSGQVPIQGFLMLEKLVALTVQGNMLTGTFKPLCDIREPRREENSFAIYLQFLYADCVEPALVECECCTCF